MSSAGMPQLTIITLELSFRSAVHTPTSCSCSCENRRFQTRPVSLSKNVHWQTPISRPRAGENDPATSATFLHLAMPDAAFSLPYRVRVADAHLLSSFPSTALRTRTLSSATFHHLNFIVVMVYAMTVPSEEDTIATPTTMGMEVKK
ncbi:hypothetical protein EGR_09125 [Echinococcus granulosus]|uniref:Uncharacterized protein n=1 Tax=Echinococcus granulosus TaxID=6210 RepID=W6U4F9_ECHGR|nr:hypothetical protein EGR_09125 [Echinococcus granulosus]EUB56000.1 hypothetical protein EGR_09125 [Echinococcus granulosus]